MLLMILWYVYSRLTCFWHRLNDIGHKPTASSHNKDQRQRSNSNKNTIIVVHAHSYMTSAKLHRLD